MTRHYLAKFFEPRSVALISTDDRAGTPGGDLLRNLTQRGFRGDLYIIGVGNNKKSGPPRFKTLADVPQPPDLAVVATASDALDGILEDCARRGIHAAVVIQGPSVPSSSNRANPKPRKRRNKTGATEESGDLAARHRIRILGPNSLGVMRPHLRLNATAGHNAALAGRTALITQSSAVCSAVLDWAASNDQGFSAVATTGVEDDVDLGDLLDYLVDDSLTDRILLQVERPKDTRRFMSAVRRAARVKPVIVLKSGRYQRADKAAEFNVGALPEPDRIFDAALNRSGALRASSIGDFFAASAVLETGRRLEGDRLAIVSLSPGLGEMTAEWASQLGMTSQVIGLRSPSDPPKKSRRTRPRAPPKEGTGPAAASPYEETLRKCAVDPSVDAILIIVAGHPTGETDALADAVATFTERSSKPVLLCWMGTPPDVTGLSRLKTAGVSRYRTPEEALTAYAMLARFRHHQKLLLSTPPPLSALPAADLRGARMIIENALTEGRCGLSRAEAKALLRAFRIPATPAVVARSPGEALIIAENIGFPVALTANTPELADRPTLSELHAKVAGSSPIREVYRHLVENAAARAPTPPVDGVTIEALVNSPGAFEVRAGLIADPRLGPVVTLDTGGGIRVGMPPLDHRLARETLTRPPFSGSADELAALSADDLDALDDTLVRLSEIACELAEIRALEISPLWIHDGAALAVGARVLLQPRPRYLPRHGHLLIPPYPADLSTRWTLTDGTPVLIRPIRPDDADIERAFIEGLSERARYFRFMQNLKALPAPMLARLTHVDYGREMALIALIEVEGRDTEVGVARYIPASKPDNCEFAIVVADAWQRRGIGKRLMEQLMAAARTYGFKRMEGDVLSNNVEMLRLAKKLGFRMTTDLEDPGVRQVSLAL